MLLLDFIDRQFIHNTPPAPTASFKDKTVIVTGANAGLGREACRWLVKLDASLVILACRSVQKGEAAAKDIQNSTGCAPETLQVWQLDLSSHSSVIAFAERAKAKLSRLDALISNAGLWKSKFELVEGNEESITVNVISLFLQGLLLLPLLHRTAVEHRTTSHFTVTSSELYEIAKLKERGEGGLLDALSDDKKANMGDRYNTSKLLEILVVKELAQQYPASSCKVIFNCVAPGFCDTSLGSNVHDGRMVRTFKRLLGRPADIGARTLVFGASAGLDSHGGYLPDCKLTPTVGLTAGKEGLELQARIWKELMAQLERIHPGVTNLRFRQS